jgi:hypothetical protein
MSDESLVFHDTFDRFFQFESYGVRVRIESNRQEILAEAEKLITKVLLGGIEIIDNPEVEAEHSFGIGLDESGIYFLFQNGKQISHGDVPLYFFNYFESCLRIVIAEHAVSMVFIHAGVVGWKGRAIVVPAHSAAGKTTLVAELVKKGAVYYSDEYAVLDEHGLVHPFARPLAMRNSEDIYADQIDVPVESIGGTAGVEPLPVGFILITEYDPKAVWKPEFLTIGQGLLDVIPHTVPIGSYTEFALNVLKKMASHAIIVRSPRNDARNFAKTLLSFLENNINYAKIT